MIYKEGMQMRPEALTTRVDRFCEDNLCVHRPSYSMFGCGGRDVGCRGVGAKAMKWTTYRGYDTVYENFDDWGWLRKYESVASIGYWEGFSVPLGMDVCVAK